MIFFRDHGECENVNYAVDSDQYENLQSCLQQCLGEVECLYVSFRKNNCKRFKNRSCEFKSSGLDDPYVTYQRALKGAFHDSSSKMCLKLLNNMQV